MSDHYYNVFGINLDSLTWARFGSFKNKIDADHELVQKRNQFPPERYNYRFICEYGPFNARPSDKALID